MPENADLSSIERRLDRLADAVEKLVLIEERQTAQGARIGLVEGRISMLENGLNATNAKVDMWVNRGVGAWALAATLFAILKTIKVI